MQVYKENIKVQKLVLITAIFLFGLKVLTYFYTYSAAVLTDSLESIINILAAAFSLYSLKLSRLPKDRDHPYGHGKIEFIASATEGILIIFAGFFLVYLSIISDNNSIKLKNVDLGILFIAISIMFNLLMGFLALRRAKKNKSIILEAGGKHMLVDSLTSILVLVNLAIIEIFTIQWVDRITTFILAIFIIFNGFKIVRKSIAGIMDEADERLITDVLKTINNNRQQHENWIDLHNLRFLKYGIYLHIDCHLTVPWYFSIKEGHNEIKKLEELITKNFGNYIEYFIHADPCENFSCSICIKSDCLYRKAKFERRLNWDLMNCLENYKHKI